MEENIDRNKYAYGTCMRQLFHSSTLMQVAGSTLFSAQHLGVLVPRLVDKIERWKNVSK